MNNKMMMKKVRKKIQMKKIALMILKKKIKKEAYH